MKKNILWLLALLLPLTGLVSCSDDDDIVFDHERPAFTLKDGSMLLEVILPSQTKADENVYIAGPFNGLNDSTVIGQEQWRLSLSDSVTGKRGIYLDPKTFVTGRTLADGYHFVSSTQRNEVTVLNDTVIRTDAPAAGQRMNVYVSRWAAFFDPEPDDQPEVKHDGFVVYVDNQTSWGDALALYMWGTVNDLNGGWPGMQPTGKQTIDGVEYTYFDMGEANSGYSENLIFNNNGGGSQLADFAYTIDHDVYLRITDSGVEELGGKEQAVKHDGYAVFVKDNTGWDALSLYMWGDVNDLNGGWPGMQPTGTQKVNGEVYTYFDMGEANTGKKENLIFNNNGGGSQLADYAYTIDHDVYLEITADGVKEISAGAKRR